MRDGETVEGSVRRVALSVADAARLTGAKPDTLRAKLRRGALAGFQDDSGAWWVYREGLDDERASSPRERGSTGARSDASREVATLRAQLEQVTDERDYLRQLADRQAAAVADATARLAALAEALAQRQLSAGPQAEAERQAQQDAPQAPADAVAAAGGGLAQTMLAEELRGLRGELARQRRPWWRRIVGG